MKIIKIGTWDKNGWPTGWSLDLEGSPTVHTENDFCGIQIKSTGEVLIGGIEIVPWTEARKSAMKEKTKIKYPQGLPKDVLAN